MPLLTAGPFFVSGLAEELLKLGMRSLIDWDERGVVVERGEWDVGVGYTWTRSADRHFDVARYAEEEEVIHFFTLLCIY